MTKVRSYYATYRAVDGRTLLGEVREIHSCRYARREDAAKRLAQVIELNGSCCVGEIHESDKFPEIFIHCGNGPPRSIGGLCFRCHKLLTKTDAICAGQQSQLPAK